MKRTWLWIVIAFVLGELACFAMDAKFVLQMGVGLILVLLPGMKIEPISLFVRKQKHKICVLLAVFFLGAFRIAAEHKPMEYYPGMGKFVLWMEHVKRSKDRVQIFSGDTLVIVPNDKIREMEEEIRIGSRIFVAAKWKKIGRATNPGEFDAYLFHKARNISRVLYAKEIAVIKSGSDFFSDGVLAVRQKGMEALQNVFDKKTSGFLQAAIFGERADLDEDLDENFRYTGVSHLLAISGLHMSILGLSLYRCLRKRIKLGFVGAGMISACFLCFYSLLVGNGVSVIRAVCMLLTAFVADMLGRSYDMPSSASFSAFFILLFSPFQLFNSGFLLSFGAIYSIGIPGMFLLRHFDLSGKTTKDKCMRSIVITLSVLLFTLPIVLYYYFGFSPYSLLLNLLFIPMMAFALYSGLAAMLLSFFHLYPAELAGGLAYGIIAWMDEITSLVRKFPHSFWIVGRPALWQIVLYYMLLGLLCAMVFGRHKRRSWQKDVQTGSDVQQGVRAEHNVWPGHGEQAGQDVRAKQNVQSVHGFAAFLRRVPIALMFAVGCVGSVLVLRPVHRDTGIYFLDVGQGDGILIRTKAQNILIDCGSTSKSHIGERVLEPALLSMGIRRVHHVFMTHLDADHVNGIDYLLNSDLIQVENLYISEFMRSELSGYFFPGTHVIGAGFYLELGRAKLHCLSPGEGHTYSDANEASLVLVYSEGDFCAVFMGDAGIQTERHLLRDYGKDLEDISLLKLGHHGSLTSSSVEFLSTTNPKYAMISYGENNRYGHPHQKVMKRLEELGIPALQTALDGAIVVETDGKGMRIVRTIVR